MKKTGLKIVLYAGGAILAILAVRYGINTIKKYLKRDQSKNVISEGEKEIQIKNLTYSQSEYATFADRLYRAMDGVGTDWDTVKLVILKLRSRSDFYELVRVFGIRESSSWMSNWEGNLIEWLTDELDTNEFKEISNILLKINVTI